MNPSLLLLDEPFTALDDRAIAVLQGLLKSALAAGRTIIMSTHQLREALELATRRCAHQSRENWPFAERAPGRCWKIPAGCIVITERHDVSRQALAIAVKDLRSEVRTKEAVNASLAFALVILLLFSFRFRSGPERLVTYPGGLLWIVFAFAGTLILNRSFARELPNDCLDALIAVAVSAARVVSGQVRWPTTC